VKIISKIKSFYQKNWVSTTAIFGLSFLVWHKMFKQVFLGEGYMYFNPHLNFFVKNGINVWGYDNSAKIIFDILPPIFRDNITAYFLLSFTIAYILFISLYLIINRITNSKLLAFSATIFFATNYIALFEYLGAGTYQRFAQRFPGIIPIIFSFYFLWKYGENLKIKNLIVAFLLWGLAVFTGHFSSLALPILLIYPIVKMFEDKPNLHKIFRVILICTTFFLISFYITNKSEQQPLGGFANFLKTQENLTQRLLYQIPTVTIPLNLVSFIGQNWITSIKDPYLPVVKFFLPITLVMYFGGIWLVFKKAPRLLTLYISLLLSMVSTMFLYMYVDTRLDVTKYFGEDRYFIFSSLFAAIMWAILLKALFTKNEISYKIATLFVLIVFVTNNTNMVWRHFDSIQYKSEAFKKFISYIKYISPQFEKDSIIIVPSYLQWPAALITEFISPNVDFPIPVDGWENKYWSIRNKVWVIDYNYDRIPSKDFDSEKGYIVDLTKNYRSGKKIQFLY